MRYKKIIGVVVVSVMFIFGLPYITKAQTSVDPTGYILLQVNNNGEAWYVYPTNGKAYYLGRPADAFEIMKGLALGVKHDLIVNTDIFPERLSGMILLDVEDSGKAYYIYPENRKKYYLGRPADAFRVMTELGRGVANSDLVNIPVGVIGEPIASYQIHKEVLIDNVPFTTQAPYGNWADDRQENACEEASAIMAVHWALGQSLSKDEALKEIIGSSDYTLKKYGEYRDVSTKDTINWIFKDYFNYNNVSLVKNIGVNDIIKELVKGNLVITPMNGQMMNNPYYKQPGPARHMIVILGYDPDTKEFITNDSGTRNGEHYRYDATVLYSSIRDYPTGYHEIIQTIEKNMIVVSRPN